MVIPQVSGFIPHPASGFSLYLCLVWAFYQWFKMVVSCWFVERFSWLVLPASGPLTPRWTIRPQSFSVTFCDFCG